MMHRWIRLLEIADQFICHPKAIALGASDDDEVCEGCMFRFRGRPPDALLTAEAIQEWLDSAAFNLDTAGENMGGVI